MHKDHSGKAMVAFFLSGEDAALVAVPDGEPVSNLHVTCMYLGETAEIQQSRVPLREAVQTLARRTAPFSGVLDRLSHFGPDDDGLTAVVLELTSDGAHVFHWNIEAALKAKQIPWDNKFPKYKPHVTLGYWPKDRIPTEYDTPGPIDPIRVSFSDVTVKWNEERVKASFGGTRSGDNSTVESLAAVQASVIEETESLTSIQASAFTLLEFHGDEHNEKAHGRRGPNKGSLSKLKVPKKGIPSLKPSTRSDGEAGEEKIDAPEKKADAAIDKGTTITQPTGGSGIKGPGPQAGNQQESIEYVHEKAEDMFVNDLTNDDGDLLLPTFEGLSAKQQAKYEKHLKEVLGLSDEDIQQMYDNLDAAAAKSTADQGNWYRKENKWGLGVSKRSGVPPMYVFGAIALLSGQRKWSGNNSANKEVAERLIMSLVADEPIEVTAKDARKYNAHYTKPDKNGNQKKKNVVLGYTPLEAGTYRPSELTSHQLAAMNPWQINSQSGAVPVHQAIMMLREEITINQALTGPKQRSFTMNLTYPERPNISTNDIWHYRAIAGDIKFLLPDKSKTPTGEWLNPDPNDPSKPEVRRMTLAEFETFITKWTKKRDPDTGENVKDPETGEDLLIPQRSNTPQTLFQTGLANKADKLKGVGFYPWITKITDEAAARFTEKLKDEGKMPEGLDAIIASDFQARVWKVAGGDD